MSTYSINEWQGRCTCASITFRIFCRSVYRDGQIDSVAIRIGSLLIRSNHRIGVIINKQRILHALHGALKVLFGQYVLITSVSYWSEDIYVYYLVPLQLLWKLVELHDIKILCMTSGNQQQVRILQYISTVILLLCAIMKYLSGEPQRQTIQLSHVCRQESPRHQAKWPYIWGASGKKLGPRFFE